MALRTPETTFNCVILVKNKNKNCSRTAPLSRSLFSGFWRSISLSPSQVTSCVWTLVHTRCQQWNLLRSVQTWDTHQLLYLAYPYMGHIDVLGCKNINSVILKQICLNNLRKFILCNRHMMQPSPHKSHNNMSLTTCMGLSLSCILTKSTLSVIQMRSNIILRNPEWCPHLTFSGGRSVIWIAAIGHYKWCYYHWAITWTPHLIPLITRPSIKPLITRPSSARYITCGVCWTVWS